MIKYNKQPKYSILIFIISIVGISFFVSCEKNPISKNEKLFENISKQELLLWIDNYQKLMPIGPKPIMEGTVKTFYKNRMILKMPLSNGNGNLYFSKTDKLQVLFIRVVSSNNQISGSFNGYYEFIDMANYSCKRLIFKNGILQLILKSNLNVKIQTNNINMNSSQTWFEAFLYCLSKYILAIPKRDIDGEWACYGLGGANPEPVESEIPNIDSNNYNASDFGGGEFWINWFLNIYPPNNIDPNLNFPNGYFWDPYLGGGFGGGNGGGFSSSVTLLVNQLGLTFNQVLWLENSPMRALEILNYLQTTTNINANNIAKEHINKLISDIDYANFNQQYHSMNGSNNVWWEDDNWLNDSNNFNFDLEKDNYGQYESLNVSEKALVKRYPTHAYIISKNKLVVEQETIAIFGKNGLNDKSDAFRHAYFNAMNRRDLGIDPMTIQNIAKLFSDAHESEVPTQLQKEKDMDLWNNAIGHLIGEVMFPILTSNSTLSSEVQTKLINGELRYLSPLLSQTNDPNYFGTNGTNNILTATHGITTSTLLKPTNQ